MNEDEGPSSDPGLRSRERWSPSPPRKRAPAPLEMALTARPRTTRRPPRASCLVPRASRVSPERGNPTGRPTGRPTGSSARTRRLPRLWLPRPGGAACQAVPGPPRAGPPSDRSPLRRTPARRGRAPPGHRPAIARLADLTAGRLTAAAQRAIGRARTRPCAQAYRHRSKGRLLPLLPAPERRGGSRQPLLEEPCPARRRWPTSPRQAPVRACTPYVCRHTLEP